MGTSKGYRLPSIEKPINNIIGFIFYYRLFFVLASVIAIILFAFYMDSHSSAEHHVQNVAYVVTGGSIIIGIFYSIINYEHNLSKFKHDVKNSRDTLTFSTACKMFDTKMMEHSRTVKDFYEENETLFLQNNGKQIEVFFKGHPDIRLSFVVLLNYFETTCIGIEQNIVDQDFLKEFFKPIFIIYLKRFEKYLEYNASVNGRDIFKYFLKVARDWNSES